MTYNFDKIHKRFNTGSGKWDELTKFGVSESDDIIPFSVADMEFLTAPEIINALKNELDNSIMGYSNPTNKYRETVCNWMKTRHNWDAKPEWILNTHGVVDAFFEAIKTYTRLGDGVMLLTPVYYPMYMAINFTKRVLVDCPLIDTGKSYAIDFEDFERKASRPDTKLFILCSPHNPVGRVWTRDELTKMGEICMKYNVLVVSDEIHHDLIMPGFTHTVFASISEEFANNSITCTAPSKSFNIAGLQTSNIFIPNENLRAKYLDSLKLSNPNPKCNILGYRACEAAYKFCAKWLDEAINIIDANKKIIVDFLSREIPAIKAYNLEGTYLLWLDCRALGLSYSELENLNHTQAKLFFDEGYIFGSQGECFERWNIACPTRYINEALQRMKNFYVTGGSKNC